MNEFIFNTKGLCEAVCKLQTATSKTVCKLQTATSKMAKDLKLSSYKVIYNPPATILFVDGKKYVSKVHNEEFDEEKGLLMCLAKANDITHLDLKKIMKKAQRPKKKEQV